MKTLILSVLLFLVGLFALVWLGRYEVVAHPNFRSQQVYRLDRWTGEIVVMSRTGGTHALGLEESH